MQDVVLAHLQMVEGLVHDAGCLGVGALDGSGHSCAYHLKVAWVHPCQAILLGVPPGVELAKETALSHALGCQHAGLHTKVVRVARILAQRAPCPMS